MITDDTRRATVARVTAAFAAEIDGHDPDAAIAWPLWPDVATLIDHLGRNHSWAARIIRTGKAVDRTTLSRAPKRDARGWYEDCRAELIAALDETDPESPCWAFGERPDGNARFWARRMSFETTKHLIDLRVAGGGVWVSAPELSSIEYADAVDELFAVFLSRSRPTLAPLPGAVTLAASDLDRQWTITPDWQVRDAGDGAARVAASAADLALFVWERGDPLAQADRYDVSGDEAVVRAFAAAPVHP